MAPKKTKIASGSGKRASSVKHGTSKKTEDKPSHAAAKQKDRRQGNLWERLTPGKRALVVLGSVVLMAGLLALLMWTSIKSIVRPPVITPPPAGSSEPTAPTVSRGPSSGAQPSDGGTAASRLDGMYTVLVMGHNQGLTDVMMVVGFDTGANKIEVVNIPRDTYSNDIPSYPKKINGAYNLGGMDLVYKAVEGVIGFRPDKYVMIDYDGFVALVDTLDGVEFDVPRNMRHVSDSGKVDINLKKGLQTLTGEQALGLVRYRSGYADQDLGRIKTAQKFLTACAQKMVDTISFGKIGDYVNICIDYLDTDLTAGEMIWFVQQAFDVDMENDLNFHTPELNAYTYQGAAYVFLHADTMADLINRTVNPLSHDIKPEDLEIFNPITSGAGAVPETSTSGGSTSTGSSSGSSGSSSSGSGSSSKPTGSGSASSGGSTKPTGSGSASSGGSTSTGSGSSGSSGASGTSGSGGSGASGTSGSGTATAAPSTEPSLAPSSGPGVEETAAPASGEPTSETSAEPVSGGETSEASAEPSGTPTDEPTPEPSEGPTETGEPAVTPPPVEVSEEPFVPATPEA